MHRFGDPGNFDKEGSIGNSIKMAMPLLTSLISKKDIVKRKYTEDHHDVYRFLELVSMVLNVDMNFIMNEKVITKINILYYVSYIF